MSFLVEPIETFFGPDSCVCDVHDGCTEFGIPDPQ